MYVVRKNEQNVRMLNKTKTFRHRFLESEFNCDKYFFCLQLLTCFFKIPASFYIIIKKLMDVSIIKSSKMNYFLKYRTIYSGIKYSFFSSNMKTEGDLNNCKHF